LVSALKEGATFSLMVVLEVKSEVLEGVYVVDVEGAAPTTASTLIPLLPLSCYAHATQAALTSLGAPPIFEPLRTFECIFRRSTKESIGTRCSGYMISDGRMTIRLVPCIGGWRGLLENLEVCSRKVSS
jgi:hypothetical protein